VNRESDQSIRRDIAEENMFLSDKQQLCWVQELYEIGQNIAKDDPTKVRQQLLDHVVKVFSAASGSIALKEDEEHLKLVAGSGMAAPYVGTIIRIGEPILGWVAKHNEPVLVNGALSDDERFSTSEAAQRKRYPVSSMCWPLIKDKRVIGAISLNRISSQPPYGEEDLARGGMMLGVISLVVDNMRLHEVRQRRIKDLSEMNQLLAEQQEELIKAHMERVVSEVRLTSILDIAPAGIIVVDETGLMSVFNKGAERIFDYTASEVLGQPYEILLPDRFREAHWHFAAFDEIAKWLQSRKEIFGKRSDGSEFTATANVSEMSLDGSILYTVVMADITEQQLAEEALRKEKEEQESLVKKLQEAQSQLLQSEKMASIGQLAAGIAHEINNPVGYINSNLSTLKKYIVDLFRLFDSYEQIEETLAAPDKFRSVAEIKEQIELEYLRDDLQGLLQETQDGVMRVKQIVQDLKDFSHVDGAEWQWADIHAGLSSTLNIVHNELKYKAEVVKEYGNLPEVECIISQLNQVFMNLLVNAAQAIEEHGIITVRSGCDSKGVWVEIKDTGKGMDEATQKRIFDPFFTTKPVGKGTGLGLSLSYNIIKKHHGCISVASAPGEGATFHIWLPFKQAQQQPES